MSKKLWRNLVITGFVLSLAVLALAAYFPVDLIPSRGAHHHTTDEAWCESMMQLPNHQWREQQTLDFAKFCLSD